MERIAILLAGGKGARLWPFSRASLPKQLIPLEQNRTLLGLTLQRMERLFPGIRSVISTTEQQSAPVQALVGDKVTVLKEPSSRNTAPALLHACRTLASQSPSATLIFLPSDHLIEQEDQFKKTLTAACSVAEKTERLVLIGVQQTEVATQYGFIRCGERYEDVDDDTVSTVAQFHEKPDATTATNYYTDSEMFWNAGMVIGTVSAFLKAFEECAPDLSATTSHGDMPALSFDRAVLERYTGALVVRGNFAWRDVGTLASFIPACVASSQSVLELSGAARNLISASKPVICVGVSDLCLIEREDMMLLMPRSSAEKAEEIAVQVRHAGWDQYL